MSPAGTSRRAALILLTSLLAAAVPAAPARAVDTRDVLGVAHVAGRYSFGTEDFLNEGADRLLDLGTRVIKVWFSLDPASSYPFNSDWGPNPANLVELAQKPYYQALFAKPFHTYVLVVLTASGGPEFIDGMTADEVAAEHDQMYQLTRYLLTTYAGTGKTFILQNWEGDHLLRQGLANGKDPNGVRLQGMRDWLNARQDGVEQARSEVSTLGVDVYHAVEVNLLADAMAGKVTATNDVVPFTHADLYSYSSWDIGFDRDELIKALDYLRSKAPSSAAFGPDNIYLGEFGISNAQANDLGPKRDVIRNLADAALGWGVRYALFWQLYDNEQARPYEGRPKNDDLPGFWLIRPDGTKTASWNDLQRIASSSLHRVALASSGGPFVIADGGGGGDVQAGGWSVDTRAVFSIRDLSGGSLRSGDAVTIQAHNGMYLHADNRGAMRADSVTADAAERFVLRKVGGKGVSILPGDSVAIQSSAGRYLEVDGGSSNLRATAKRYDATGVFRLVPQD